jgi:hypothetical protein
MMTESATAMNDETTDLDHAEEEIFASIVSVLRDLT